MKEVFLVLDVKRHREGIIGGGDDLSNNPEEMLNWSKYMRPIWHKNKKA